MKPIEILHIEDNPAEARITAEVLQSIGIAHTITIVPNAIEALAFLRKEGAHGDAIDPDLILLDLSLPRMRGVEFLEAMQADDHLKEIPIVVLTGSVEAEDKRELDRWPIYEYIVKPSDFDEYITRFQTFMNDFSLRHG